VCRNKRIGVVLCQSKAAWAWILQRLRAVMEEAGVVWFGCFYL